MTIKFSEVAVGQRFCMPGTKEVYEKTSNDAQVGDHGTAKLAMTGEVGFTFPLYFPVELQSRNQAP